MQITTRELVDAAAAAADMTDNYITPAQWMRFASQEHLTLALLLARSGWTQNVLSTTITVAGTEAGVYNLTVTPLALVAVHIVRSGRVREVHFNNAIDFLRQSPGTSGVHGDPTEYRVLWDQANDRLSLGFYPEPSTGTTLSVSYIPEPLRLTLDASPASGYANSVKYPMGWEERIWLGMARRALAKEDTDTTEIRRLIAECESGIEEAVFDRVLGSSPTVRNLDLSRRGWDKTVAYPAPSNWWFF